MPTFTVLLRLPENLRETDLSYDQVDFAIQVQADTAAEAGERAASYLVWHFDTDCPDRAAAAADAEDVECIGIAEGEIAWVSDYPTTLHETTEGK